jgi:molybdopterin molybdotransferase
LAAAAELAGADVVALGIARDDPAELADRIQQGLTCDALVIAGGVSAGRLDLVPAALRTAGVQQVFHKVSLKPGKPLWFGVRHGAGRPTLVFGLPGNPVSSRVCFELFVRPALERVRGAMPTGTPRLAARLGCSFQHVGDRPTYYPGRWQSVGGDLSSPAGSPSPPWVAPLSWHGSGDLHALSQASVLIHFPAGEHVYAAGDLVEVLLFNL